MRSLLKTVAVSSCAVALGVAASLGAQEQQANPVSAALKSTMESMQRNLAASAEAMPADKYSFRPTPAQMSFGQLVLHVAGTNYFMCSTIAGSKAPQVAKLEATAAKETLVARIKESFEYCSTTLASADDSKLGEVVPYFGGRKISRGGAMLGLAEDWGDHYSAAATYQRLNGILPPTAKRGAGM
ncbi:MAG: DinB family protein [Gemmatimonadota bacterium]|nr:DinB family protein [Gemmatimonadota bacterium]